ncbi:MAG: DEAD/DEAH box helicase [Opitutales bacterium]
MQTNSEEFGGRIFLPDSWQRQALNEIRGGKDVVLHAPTGAGKTFVFEQLIDSGFKGRAVYTVPTRALANDKFREWQERGWEVGLITGDLRYRPDSQVVVATLETQRGAMAGSHPPDLFVVDEYQLLSDSQRGAGYEVTLALAQPETSLLLMSGSVANPHEVAEWLAGHGRRVAVIEEHRRPVPLEEVLGEALIKRSAHTDKIRGHWPKLIDGALRSGMGPVLLFAPRRKAAEELARQLAHELPETEILELTPEQRRVAGKELSSLLRRRVAFHHSGLDYQKRAGLVEPLAKAGQLQVVVATTGLGAGVNFSMRSVLVTDREYRVDDQLLQVRPDELLQMYGRAGRRGKDTRGYVVVASRQARLADARPLRLHRSSTLDWPALLTVMNQALEHGENHIEAARQLAERLFSEEHVRLGFRDSLGNLSKLSEAGRKKEEPSHDSRKEVVEMLNSSGLWERRGGQVKGMMSRALVLQNQEWVAALSLPKTLSKIQLGNPCRFGTRKSPTYGKEVPVAIYVEESMGEKVTLIKSFRKVLRQAVAAEQPRAKKKFSRKTWARLGLEDQFRAFFPFLSQGGELVEFVDRGKVLSARLSYENAQTLGWKDSRGRFLLNPKLRKTFKSFDSPFDESSDQGRDNLSMISPLEAWYVLGLVDSQARPTNRGRIFSQFSRGEGLAVAVGLEDESYPLDEFIYDLANLRAGHRFKSWAKSESRLSALCRQAYGFKDCPGYLRSGLPLEYGEGGVDFIRERTFNGSEDSEDLGAGDVERLMIEWKSLLDMIIHGPDLGIPRWSELQTIAQKLNGSKGQKDQLPELPELPARQRKRYESQIRR